MVTVIAYPSNIKELMLWPISPWSFQFENRPGNVLKAMGVGILLGVGLNSHFLLNGKEDKEN